jgi:hypothetical protein
MFEMPSGAMDAALHDEFANITRFLGARKVEIEMARIP